MRDHFKRATGGLKRFLDDGGNLLIATDRSLHEPELGIHISGQLVRSPRVDDEWRGYHGLAQCPFVDFAERDHPLFAFLGQGLASNCPSHVNVAASNESLHDLMIFPFGPIRIGEEFRGGRRRFMVGSPKDAPPHGRALIVAGHGMFMNAMILQADNDNFQFTVNIVDWLREGEGKAKRTRALLIVDGTIIDDFDMKLDPPPPSIPLPHPMIIAQLIRGMENERKFHFLLGKALDENLGLVVAILFGIVTFFGLMYGAKKFMEGRSHLETTVPSMIEPKPLMEPSAPAEQGRQAILKQPDLYEEARHLVLQWFKQTLSVTPQRWHDAVDARFEVHGSFWSCWGLQSKADGVLDLATRKEPIHVDRHQFLVLLDTLRDLAEALADGRLVLLIDGKNVRQ
ncbi:MAG: hypothetical protein HYR84_10585 [Planctomycetes bacterium]|nr:hypothetical protein [Planctomycetota bacterium]